MGAEPLAGKSSNFNLALHMKISFYPKIRNNWLFYSYYSMRALVLLGIIGFLLTGDFASAVNAALILGLMLLPRLIKGGYNIHLPMSLEFAIVSFIFVSLFLGSLSDFYEKFPLFDGVLHFQSGILMGLVGFVMVFLLNSGDTEKFRLSPLFVSFFSVCFSLAISVVWEIYEYTLDTWFGYTMQETGIPDTMGDLIVNLLGALLVAMVGYLWMKRRKKLPFAPEQFMKNVEVNGE